MACGKFYRRRHGFSVVPKIKF